MMKLIGRRFTPGRTTSMALLSAASQKWNWTMNNSSEHLPRKAKAREDVERRRALAFRSMTNARMGKKDMYGCQALYAILDSWWSSNAKNHMKTTIDMAAVPLTRIGQCGASANRVSRILIVMIATSMPTYTIQISKLTRNAHSRAFQWMPHKWLSHWNRASNNQFWRKNQVIMPAESVTFVRRIGVRLLSCAAGRSVR